MTRDPNFLAGGSPAPVPAPLPPASIPDGLLYAWESQRRQYPKAVSVPRNGALPSIHVRRFVGVGFDADGDLTADVDALLYYDKKGALRGILNHYPHDTYERPGVLDTPLMRFLGATKDDERLERAGNINIWVDPGYHDHHVGSELLTEATRRYGAINFLQQRYTQAGRTFTERWLDRARDCIRCGTRAYPTHKAGIARLCSVCGGRIKVTVHDDEHEESHGYQR